MARSWTVAPSPSTSLARAKSVREEEAAVANLAADAAAVAAVAVIATKSWNVVIRRGTGKPGLAFSLAAPLGRSAGFRCFPANRVCTRFGTQEPQRSVGAMSGKCGDCLEA